MGQGVAQIAVKVVLVARGSRARARVDCWVSGKEVREGKHQVGMESIRLHSAVCWQNVVAVPVLQRNAQRLRTEERRGGEERWR